MYNSQNKDQSKDQSKNNKNIDKCQTAEKYKSNTGEHHRNTSTDIREHSSHYHTNQHTSRQNSEDSQSGVDRLSKTQQQFVLKFCNQLASVIKACEQSESAEIEVGRRQINTRQIKVKLQADRELTIDTQQRQ